MCIARWRGCCIEIGNYLEYQTYTSDRNRAFDGKRLGDLCRLQQVPPFTYPDLVETVARDAMSSGSLRGKDPSPSMSTR
jgi:hypothetical protein